MVAVPARSDGTCSHDVESRSFAVSQLTTKKSGGVITWSVWDAIDHLAEPLPGDDQRRRQIVRVQALLVEVDEARTRPRPVSAAAMSTAGEAQLAGTILRRVKASPTPSTGGSLASAPR